MLTKLTQYWWEIGAPRAIRQWHAHHYHWQYSLSHCSHLLEVIKSFIIDFNLQWIHGSIVSFVLFKCNIFQFSQPTTYFICSFFITKYIRFFTMCKTIYSSIACVRSSFLWNGMDSNLRNPFRQTQEHHKSAHCLLKCKTDAWKWQPCEYWRQTNKITGLISSFRRCRWWFYLF